MKKILILFLLLMLIWRNREKLDNSMDDKVLDEDNPLICQTIEDNNSLDDQASNKANNNDKQDGVEPIEEKSEYEMISSDEKYFERTEINGLGAWYKSWVMHDDNEPKEFIVDGVVYTYGRGFDGRTIEGIDDRDYSVTTYKVLTNEFDSILGIFGFDDNTKVYAECFLDIQYDGETIYSSSINKNIKLVDIDIELPDDIETITFKFKFEKYEGVMPKVVLADIKAHRAIIEQ